MSIFYPHSGNDDWKKEKIIYDSKIAILEPFTESVPSLIVLIAIWYTSAWIQHDDTFQG